MKTHGIYQLRQLVLDLKAKVVNDDYVELTAKFGKYKPQKRVITLDSFGDMDRWVKTNYNIIKINK